MKVPRWKTDDRPMRHGWAPGGYIHFRCGGEPCKGLEDSSFIGAKRCWMCADCAYALPDPVVETRDRVQIVVDGLVSRHPDKWEQALLRPQLVGWFVGQAMKNLNGTIDADYVYERVMEKFGAKP